MEQLKAAIARLTLDIERGFAELASVRHVLEDLQHTFAVERWWRRVLVGFVCLVLVSVGAWMSWDRQRACDRTNASRTALRESAVSDWETAWAVLVAEDDPATEARKAELLAAIDENRAERLPLRDCAWPV